MKRISIKIIVLLVIIIATSTNAFGWGGVSDRNWQIEPFFGLNYPLASVDGMVNQPFIEFGIEYRHIMRSENLWIGAEAAVMAAARVYDTEENMTKKFGVREGYGDRVLSTCFVTEYRFDVSDYFCPFVGLGVGTGSMSGQDYPGRNMGFILRPRVGAQIGRHFRLTLHGSFIAIYYNTVSLRIGWAF